MGAPEVRHRAVVGAVVDSMRASGLRLIGLAGTIVTARLLSPYDFGLVAIGTTILTFGAFLDDGGVGTALIRRPEDAEKAELQAVLALQLMIDVVLVIGIALVMLPFGMLGRVTTVIVASLPLGACRAPAYIIYERRMIYRPMAIVELIETSVYYVWAIVTIAVGWGVWGLATAFIVRELVGSLLVLILLPEGRILPVPSWQKVRGLISFGLKFQAVGLLHMLRDQGVNIMVASFGGVAVLGLWQVAWRVLQLPISLLQALWRVSMPGMARLVAAKEDVGPTIERVIPLVAIGTGALVAPLAASAPAWIHVLLGARWSDAALSIPSGCFAMAFGVPVSVALSGYLWAIGNASVPLRATAAGIPATLLVLLALLPLLGIAAVGIAYIANALVESLFFVWAARQTASFRIVAGLGIPVLLATAAGTCGWLTERWVGDNLVGAVASSAVALAAFTAGLAVVHRPYLSDAWRLISRGLRGAVAPAVTA